MPVHYERQGAAAVLTIDRQERRNAVDGPTAVELAAGYEQFVADDDARVLILTGAGGVAFCAGADLKAIDTLGDRLQDPAGPLGFTRLTPRSQRSPRSTAGVWPAGSSWHCGVTSNRRDTSTLGFPERRWGVPLIDGGTQRLPGLWA